MKEIGGYFGLECGRTPPYHEGVYLNSGKNALRHIVRSFGIRKMYIPYYTCRAVGYGLEQEACEIERYELNAELLPSVSFPEDAYVLYTNYFGVNGRNVELMMRKYKNLIVDNSQAFFSRRTGRAAIYSPRKFFGIPDGGIAVGKGLSAEGLPIAHSFDNMGHVLKRVDMSASDGFDEYKANTRVLFHSDVQRMSKLTFAIMGTIDYSYARDRRLANFEYLHSKLNSAYPFAKDADDVPMVYPFLSHDSGLRERLIEQKIYVAKYWPNIERCDLMVNTLLPLPIDQRYTEDDMLRIVEAVNG